MAVKITKAQRELLLELKERGRFADYLDQRTLKALIKKGLASIYGYTPGGDDAKAHITPGGNEFLERPSPSVSRPHEGGPDNG